MRVAASFESLLTDLSSTFLRATPDALDVEIQKAQQKVCDHFGFDISALFQQVGSDPENIVLTHLHRPAGGPELPPVPTARDLWPWALSIVMTGDIVRLSSLEELPPEAHVDKANWIRFHVKSCCAIPFLVGGGPLFGGLTFDTTQCERTWPDDLVSRLKLVAEIIGGALARRNADQALRESEYRLSLAADAADAGFWTLDLATHELWTTPRTRKLFGLPLEGPLTLAHSQARVHPEDRERFNLAVQTAITSGMETSCEYRIVLEAGKIRWVVSRGRIMLDTNRLCGVTLDITASKDVEAQLRQSLAEVRDLRDRLEQENLYLREDQGIGSASREILGESAPILEMLGKARRVGPTDSAVLITGETGTGKELLARAIHEMSGRRHHLMITVNCGALPESLIESELFGRERGAYTGAMTQQKGRFEAADGSTIFLDEIAELPLNLQTRLLRVLQEGQFERLGSSRTQHVNVRIIAATNRDLRAQVQRGLFRDDLYFRLNVFPIHVAPLRERRDDIPLLVWGFVRHFAAKMGKSIDTIPRKVMEQLQQYAWPGNVRELRNLIERAVILTDSRVLHIDPPAPMAAESNTIGVLTLEDLERQHIRHVLAQTHWRISGKAGAAEILGILPTTLHSRMRKLGIFRPGSGGTLAGVTHGQTGSVGSNRRV